MSAAATICCVDVCHSSSAGRKRTGMHVRLRARLAGSRAAVMIASSRGIALTTAGWASCRCNTRTRAVRAVTWVEDVGGTPEDSDSL